MESEKTSSGYPRVARRVSRGQDLGAAPIVFEGETDDVGVFPAMMETRERRIPLIVQSPSFFTQLYYVLTDSEPVLVPIPEDATLDGLLDDTAIVTLRTDWEHRGKTFAQGAVVAFDWDDFIASGEIGRVNVLFEPSERVSVQGVAVGPEAAYLSLLDNVTGKVRRVSKTWRGWRSRSVDLPGDGDLSLVSVSPYEDTAFALYDGFLMPNSLFELAQGAPDEPIKSLPGRFSTDGLAVSQFEAVSKDGTKVPYFLVRPEGRTRPAPDAHLWVWRL